jgi:uncharacterized protein
MYKRNRMSTLPPLQDVTNTRQRMCWRFITTFILFMVSLPLHSTFQCVSPTRWYRSNALFFSKSNSLSTSYATISLQPNLLYAHYRIDPRGIDSYYNRNSVILYMAKGDGKKRRKKATEIASSPTANAKASPSLSNTPSPSPPPLRVTTNINIPIRHQLRMAQFNKELRSSESTSSFRSPKKLERTKYRRTWDEEEIELKAIERRKKGQDPDWAVILNQTQASPLLIVDGYNIIHKWPRLKKHLSKGDLQRARQLLLDDLETMQAMKGWRIECVFDGARRSLVGPLGVGPGGTTATSRMDQATSMHVSQHGVRVVYTGMGTDADAYIEARCSQAKQVTHGQLTRSFLLATDDAMLRLAGQNAGALCLSADRFVDELKALRKTVDYQVEAAVAKVNGVAMRPESLRGTHIHVSRFGRRSVLIEDKRNRTKTRRQQQPELEVVVPVVSKEEASGIPWWAQVPNQTSSNGRS